MLRSGRLRAWPSTHSIKYLGLQINLKLDWGDHWDMVDKAVKANMRIVKKSSILAAKARYTINTKIMGLLRYHFQHAPFREKELEAWQSSFNSAIKNKLQLGGAVHGKPPVGQ